MRVRAEKLTMRFQDADRIVELFSDLSFEVGEGASLAIVGESGVGKTTLLYVLGGLEAAVGGRVYIGDTCLQELNSYGRDVAEFRGKNIGFIFQFHHLLPEFNALENVAMPLLLQGVPFDEARERAVKLLRRVGLEKRIDHRPSEMSGGEQQRVAVARAIVAKPGVILADEPTGNLDHKTGAEISSLLCEVQREEKITLLVVTHSLELARLMDHMVELTPKGLQTFNKKD